MIFKASFQVNGTLKEAYIMAQDVTAAGRTFQGNRVKTQEKAKIN